MSPRKTLALLLLVAVVGLAGGAGCAAPTGPVVQPTGSSARGAYDSWVMTGALAEACADVASSITAAEPLAAAGSVANPLAVAPASEGAWTLMAASEVASALRRRGRAVRLLDRDLATTHPGIVVVVKTTYVAVDTDETRIPLSKWSLLSHPDVNAVVAGTVAAISFATWLHEDLGVRRGGCASVTAYVIDQKTKKMLLVVTGTDERGRRL